jgi:hypothetical protein
MARKDVKKYRFIWFDKVNTLRVDLTLDDGTTESLGPISPADFPMLREILGRSPLSYETADEALIVGWQTV